MADEFEDLIIEAIAAPELTIESEGERITRRSVKELSSALEIVRERAGKSRPFVTILHARYEE